MKTLYIPYIHFPSFLINIYTLVNEEWGNKVKMIIGEGHPKMTQIGFNMKITGVKEQIHFRVPNAI